MITNTISDTLRVIDKFSIFQLTIFDFIEFFYCFYDKKTG